MGFLLAVCQALENSTSPLSDSPVAAAVVSHFNKCPDSHTQYCFHGTCRFLVQEEKPACVCHSGYVGVRCEHADLLAVVAASQKKQAITALVVVSIVALAVLIITCVLIHSAVSSANTVNGAAPSFADTRSPAPSSREGLLAATLRQHGLKIPEEEFGQAAYDSPTKERCLGTTPPQCSGTWDMLGDLPPQCTTAWETFCPLRVFKL
ncbi:Protransforming growth factor alpha [Apodemus speciosus]|uniref:Protransforming growth factor alpha n=1 Tax=Apodemus speciosus TaxID=105296 RepID=A0ABQ0EW19_APOSI